MTNKIINKDELIKIIAKKAGFTQGDVRILLDALVATFEESVRDERTISIPGLGQLTVNIIPAHVGYNPLTRKRQDLPDAKRITFRLSKNIKNGGTED